MRTGGYDWSSNYLRVVESYVGHLSGLCLANVDEKKSLLTIEDVDSENVHDTDEDVKKWVNLVSSKVG